MSCVIVPVHVWFLCFFFVGEIAVSKAGKLFGAEDAMGFLRSRRKSNDKQKLKYLIGRLIEWQQNGRRGAPPAVRTWFPGMADAFASYGLSEQEYYAYYGTGFPRDPNAKAKSLNIGIVLDDDQGSNPSTPSTPASDAEWKAYCEKYNLDERGNKREVKETEGVGEIPGIKRPIGME
jgi:hypothetical protein